MRSLNLNIFRQIADALGLILPTTPRFLPCDGGAERGYEIARRLSVRLSATFKCRDHIGWKSCKIISRSNSVRPMHSLAPQHGRSVATGMPQN